ncbi:MAG: DUF3043 domain-containing protein [Nocardioidaceae bacterium]
MFRRTKSDTDATPPPAKPGGKGRPTPTRREAEAAARARAKQPRTRKELAAAQRASRTDASQKMRAAMRSGDDRYLPPRDRGPVRRFIRDFVDSRFQFIQVLLPMLLVALVLPWVSGGSERVLVFSNMLTLTSLVLVVYDVVMLRFRLRRELTKRFPDESLKGTTSYAVMRSMQLKFTRQPKPQVRMGEKLPETYR